MANEASLHFFNTCQTLGTGDILFEPATERVYVFSHSAPNATVIDAKDGSVVGTIDLGGAPEQAASDGQGHLYVDIEDQDNVAVVDVKTLKVTAHYDLGGKGRRAGRPGFGRSHFGIRSCAGQETPIMPQLYYSRAKGDRQPKVDRSACEI